MRMKNCSFRFGDLLPNISCCKSATRVGLGLGLGLSKMEGEANAGKRKNDASI